MTSPDCLGALASQHELSAHLLESIPTDEAAHPYAPDLGCLSWWFAQGVWLELYWLRERLLGDDRLTRPIRPLFHDRTAPAAGGCTALPPVDHLLKWARDIWDEHLLRLANPGGLPRHPWLEGDRLPWFLAQQEALAYERMLMVLARRQHRRTGGFRVSRPLRARAPKVDAATVVQGHFRVGALDDPAAYDNERPPQVVKLAVFRIARHPATHAEYLAFMEDGGYQTPDYWDEAGRAWLRHREIRHPAHWRADARGHWFGISVNGPAELTPEDPVSGISRHEARAYAAWAAARIPGLAGAVVQHEYQWEVAARMGLIEDAGRVQEWCANPFHPYPEFSPWPDEDVSVPWFDHHGVLRGASLHGQRPIRRVTFRGHESPDWRYGFSGTRLVLPPDY